MPRIWIRSLTAVVLGLALAGCGAISRPAFTDPVAHTAPKADDLDRYRFAATDDEGFLAWYRRFAYQRISLGLDGVSALALSGGGADGAYGAGVLVGWTKAGDRPKFDLVTGVSTGALIAPLAFAGPAWDDRLAAAYHDPDMSRLTEDRLGFLFGPSLFGSEALTHLVDKYVDGDLLRAVAAEHEKGRRLLVATTNLDSQETVIWDLGAIARDAGRPDDRGRSLRLFRSVLVASSSIPGVFPPVFIRGERQKVAEMHVDGGVNAPFFLVPESMLLWTPDASMASTDLYVIVNGKLGPSYERTHGGARELVLRSLDTLGRAQARAQITAARGFAEKSGGHVAVTAVPDAQAADPFDFSLASTGALFQLGYDLAAGHRAFRPAGEAVTATLR